MIDFSPSASPAAGAAAPGRPWDLTRIILAVVAIGGLILASFSVLRPFLPAVVWATMIVVATWPTLRAVQARLWGRRSLAVVVMTLAMLAVLAVPLTVAVVALLEAYPESRGIALLLRDHAEAEPGLADTPEAAG